MWLNVTQKSRDLFRDYPSVRSQSVAQQAALTTPMFSWHATVQPVRRQRIVLLGHDASALCVVLPQKTGTTRLDAQFWTQLAAQWEHYRLPAAWFAAYRRSAGHWRINQPINRRQVRRLNEQAWYVTFLIQEQAITAPLELALLAAQTPALGHQDPEHLVNHLKLDLALGLHDGNSDKQP